MMCLTIKNKFKFNPVAVFNGKEAIDKVIENILNFEEQEEGNYMNLWNNII